MRPAPHQLGPAVHQPAPQYEQSKRQQPISYDLVSADSPSPPLDLFRHPACNVSGVSHGQRFRAQRPSAWRLSSIDAPGLRGGPDGEKRMAIPANKRLSFVDRSGRIYTRDEFFGLMRKIYPRSPKAFALLFPEYGMMNIKSYAKGAGIRVRRSQLWTDRLDEIGRQLHPNYDAISQRTGRTRKAVKLRCARLKICDTAACPGPQRSCCRSAWAPNRSPAPTELLFANAQNWE